MHAPDLAALIGVTPLAVTLPGRALPLPAYVFEPHRLALPCWVDALQGLPPALLLTFDRHFDLVPPAAPAEVPDRSAGVAALAAHARARLDPRNFDHVLAALEAGLIGDVLCLARAAPKGSFAGALWTDHRGGSHRIARAPGLAPLLPDGPLADLGAALLHGDAPIVLDIDLDAFTTPSDADPTEPIAWSRESIRRYLLPPGSTPFWDVVRPRLAALTLAREPLHVGGLVAEARLFLDAAPVIFGELLGAELP